MFILVFSTADDRGGWLKRAADTTLSQYIGTISVIKSNTKCPYIYVSGQNGRFYVRSFFIIIMLHAFINFRPVIS